MTHLQDELNKLRDSLNDMSYQVMNQLSKSVESLMKFDKDLAHEVIRHEKRINALEIKIDKECEFIFTLMNPVAKDMRFVFATLKINTDLERIADYAENISLMVVELEKPFDKALLNELEVEKMANTALAMLTDTIAGYSTENADITRGVFADDAIINEIHRKAKPVIANQCKKDPDNILSYMDLWSVVRRIERVGDHITNVAEEIIFYLEATVLKHSGKQTQKKGNGRTNK